LKQGLKELKSNDVGLKNEMEKEVKKRRWSRVMVKEGRLVIETVNRFNAFCDNVTEIRPLPKVRVWSQWKSEIGKEECLYDLVVNEESVVIFCKGNLEITLRFVVL